MKNIKKLGLSYMYIIVSLIILTFIITLLHYFNIIDDKIINIINIFIPNISMIIGGLYIGRKSNKSGYIEGLKLGILASILFIIINLLIFNNSFKLKYILFYIILCISSILGSIIGINSNKKV